MNTTTNVVELRRHSLDGGEETFEVRTHLQDGSQRSVYFNYTDSGENRKAGEEVALAKALRLELAGKPVRLEFTTATW